MSSDGARLAIGAYKNDGNGVDAGHVRVYRLNCDASTAPANGANGDCTHALASGTTCQPVCNSGYIASGPTTCTAGVLTAATCSACAANYYSDGTNCVACAAGYANGAGDSLSSASACGECAANHYVDGSTCVACPSGTTRPAGDVIASGDTACAGEECGVNEYVSGHRCVACATGYENAAGDAKDGADTTCPTFAPASSPVPWVTLLPAIVLVAAAM